MSDRRHVMHSLLRCTLLIGAGLGVFAGCMVKDPRTTAKRITQRQELIGGPRALGEVGDWLLQNDQVRFIVQDEGFSRGFGVYGGSLIDADLIRPGTGVGDSSGGEGKDNFGEMFPAFFLEAMEPHEVNDPNASGERLPAVSVENDGSDGNAAVVVVRGYGNDFLAMTETINTTLLNDPRDDPNNPAPPNLLFLSRYILHPGVRYIEIETTVQNISPSGETLRWDTGAQLLGEELPTPFGDIVLFGAGNKVFLPHDAGYDLRYRLEEAYQSEAYALPALPGLVTDFIATTSDEVSYGIVAAAPQDPQRNYAYSTGQFPGAEPYSMHVPFIASAFTGLFQVTPPVLEGNDGVPGGSDEFRFTRYFIVGTGDVASISNVAYEILGMATGKLSGRLLEEQTHVPFSHGRIIVLDSAGTKVTQCTTDSHGRFSADLRPGKYDLLVVVKNRTIPKKTSVEIRESGHHFVNLKVEPSSRVVVTVFEPGVGPVPAKVSLVGTLPEETIGQDTKEHLFDLSLGQSWRYSDLVTDTTRPESRRYIENFDYTHNGTVVLEGRPGRYQLFAGRGTEYTRFQQEVILAPGKDVAVVAEIQRVVDTSGYISADFHLHTVKSLDSHESIEDRILSYAGEGLEFVVATDHNFVVDYKHAIANLGLQHFIESSVGLELTTIDRGHFNGFPLQVGSGTLGTKKESGGYDNTIASRTYGSFQWAQKTPDEIFAAIRNLGVEGPPDPLCAAQNLMNPDVCPREKSDVIVQINHPRDSILGYFEQYGIDPDELEPIQTGSFLFSPNIGTHPELAPEVFSWDFDAIEVFNGKRFEYLHSFRVPAGNSIDPVSCCPLEEGDILRDTTPLDCDPEMRDCACTADDTQLQIDEGNCDPGSVSYPGVIEDWFKVLESGKRVIGTANSDSHEAHKEEPGYPKTYLRVPVDTPRDVTPAQIVEAFHQGDVLMTNGPFLRVSIGEDGLGSIVDASSGQVNVDVNVEVAPWIDVNRVRVYMNGALVAEREIVLSAAGSGGTSNGQESVNASLEFETSFELAVEEDGFLVVEVDGQESMFPSVVPNEIPPLQFSDILSAFGDVLGAAFSGGSLQPEVVFQTTPYALTNPIWLDANGDGEITPRRTLGTANDDNGQGKVPYEMGAPYGPGMAGPELGDIRPHSGMTLEKFRKLPRRKQEALAQMPTWLWPTSSPSDVRRVLWQFVRHAH